MTKKNGESRAHILSLRARDVKCVSEVSIDFEGNMHVVAGDSGQGKTTILDSIRGALEGFDPSMVRQGANSAEIELVLDNAKVTRVVGTDGKQTLLVTEKDGGKVEKAQDFLRVITGPTTFQPLKWVQLGGGEAKGLTGRLREQRDQLLAAIHMSLSAKEMAQAAKDMGPEYFEALREINMDDVDFDQHGLTVCAAMEKATYDFRKQQNSLAEMAESKLSVTPAPQKAPPNESIEVLKARLEKRTEAFHFARAKQSDRSSLAEQVTALRAKVTADEQELPPLSRVEKTRAEYTSQSETLTSEVDQIKAKIAELQQALRERESSLNDVRTKLDKCADLERQINSHEGRKHDLSQLEAELESSTGVTNLEELQADLEQAKADVQHRELQDAHNAAAEAYKEAKTRAELFDGLVKLFRDDLPKALLSKAKLPVDGLGITDDVVTINGIPLHQLGTSEQIKVGVLIAAALNPKSGFVLVDGAESMGKKDRAALAEAAKDLDLQLIMTIVDDDALPAPGITVMREGAAVPAA